jgi:antitoxin ParD1/3/4
MIRINLLVEGDLEAELIDRVQRGGFASVDAYVESLIARDLYPPDPPNLAELIQEGLNSGPGIEATPEYFESVRQELVRRHQEANAK